MTKKVSLLIANLLELKLFLPLVSEGLALAEIELSLIIYGKSTKVKQSLFYKPELNPFHDDVLIKYLNEELELYKTVIEINSDFLIVSSIPNEALKLLKKNTKTNLCYLQHSTDILSYWPYTYDKNFIMLFDNFFVFSPYWKNNFIIALENSIKINSLEVSKLKQKIHVVGLPELDQINSFNKESIRDKYGLDQNKKIVFFDTLPIVNHVPNFFYKYYFVLNGSLTSVVKHIVASLLFDIRQRKWLMWKFPYYSSKLFFSRKLPRYERLFFDLRKYCDENDLLLVTKSRKKHNDPKWLQDNCELYIIDKEFYPFSLLELMHISSFYVGFNSTAVLEGAFCNLPSELFHAFPTDYQYGEYGGGVYTYLENCMKNPQEWLNYDGVSNVHYFNQSRKNCFFELVNRPINEKDYCDYIEKFLGFKDGKSSKRVFEVISKL